MALQVADVCLFSLNSFNMCLESSLKSPSMEETSTKLATDTLPQPTTNTELVSVDHLARARQMLTEFPLIGTTCPTKPAMTPVLDKFPPLTPAVDGHNDFPYMLRGWFANKVNSQSFSIDTLPIGQTDLSRLSRGHVGAQFWSAFVPWYITFPLVPPPPSPFPLANHQDPPKKTKRLKTYTEPLQPINSQTKTDEFSTPTNLPSLLQTLQQIDLIHTLIKQHPRQLAFTERADDILPIFRSGRVASLIGVEGLHQIANSASVLRMYHRLGVRYVTLCHDSNNRYADSAVSICFLVQGRDRRVDVVMLYEAVGE